MPTGGAIGNAYVRVLLQARAAGHTLGRQAVARIILALREDVKRLDGLAASDPVTAERARAIRAQTLAIVQALEQQTISLTRDSVRLTVNQIVSLHESLNLRLLRHYGVDAKGLAGAFDSINVRALAAVGSRARNAATFRTLVNRHMEQAAPALDRLLTAGIARGVSSRKLTGDVAEILKGNSPDLSDYEMPRTALSGMRSITSDARMIAVSETNNAMREASRQALATSPIVSAAKWQLSGNHVTGCECEDIAAEDIGYGPGFYPPEQWPVAPHPNCACYAGEVLFKPVSEWGDSTDTEE